MTTNSNFNNAACLSPGEYIGDTHCPDCGSLVKIHKTKKCASCRKAAAASTKAKPTFHKKRRDLDLEQEMNRINHGFEYDLVEYE